MERADVPEAAKTGLLLIKIGVALAFIIPTAIMFAFSSIAPIGFFSAFPGGVFFAIMIAFLAIGGALSIVALKFGIEAVRTGQKNKTDYVIILGAVTFLIGSNVAGIVIAVGGYLLRKALK